MPRQQRTGDFIASGDFLNNLDLMCGIGINESTLSSPQHLLQLLDSQPCASAAATITMLAIEGKEIPRNPEEQEKLLQNITTQQLISFDAIIEQEILETQGSRFSRISVFLRFSPTHGRFDTQCVLHTF